MAAAATAAKPSKKKFFKELAVINADNCTGCDACVEVCPVDCIYKVPGPDLPGLQAFCDIDLDRCIGCSLCERWCPWDAIDMIPTPKIAEAVAQKGGPPDYVEKNWDRLVAVAHELATLYVENQAAKKK
jgi:electron transport complex protein RnfB